jgi:hypothetical protein
VGINIIVVFINPEMRGGWCREQPPFVMNSSFGGGTTLALVEAERAADIRLWNWGALM